MPDQREPGVINETGGARTCRHPSPPRQKGNEARNKRPHAAMYPHENIEPERGD